MSNFRNQKREPASSFYHDYETSGAQPQLDRPTQFAGIRVDQNLNEIEVFDSIYCNMQDDCLPQPMAFLVTRLKVSDVIEKGLPEFEFANKVFEQFSRPNTTVLGYNTINFDDEVTRNMFHRNLINPYDREWRNGNSRWDLINVVRMAAAVYGNKDYNGEKIFNVPLNEEGRKSFRLEDLSAANGIEHENAHDALSDVYATIGMAEKIFEKEPEFFRKMEERRLKNVAKLDLMAFDKLNPVLLCSPFFGAEKSYVGFVIPIAVSESNANEVYCIKLDGGSQGVSNILDFSSEEILKLLFEKNEKLEEAGMVRPSLTSIRINACPVYLTTSDIREIFEDEGERKEFYSSISVDVEDLAESFKLVRANLAKLKEKVTEIYGSMSYEDTVQDVDLSIYTGGFPSNEIAMLKAGFVKDLLAADNDEDRVSVFKNYLNQGDDDFQEQVFRVAFRSYPEAAANLGSEYVTKWNNHCYSRIHEKDKAASISYADFIVEVNNLLADEKWQDEESQQILNGLAEYGAAIAEKYDSMK